MNGFSLDSDAIIRMQNASDALTRIPAGADPVLIIDALRNVLPVAGGLVSVVDPARLHAMACQGIRLPLDMVELYMNMGSPMQQMAHRPLFLSKPGSLWLEEDERALPSSLRDGMEVLHRRKLHGFGHGGGYKVRERWRPWGAEHVLLALLMEDGSRFPFEAHAILEALNNDIFGAIERMSLPLVYWEPMGWQIHREEVLGYMLVSSSGNLLAINRQACEFVQRYQAAAGLMKSRSLVADFIQQAMVETAGGRIFLLCHEDGITSLEVQGHTWAQTGYAISQEATLLVMREDGPPERVRKILETMPRRLREIAILLGNTDLGYKNIARDPTKLGAVRKQVELVYRGFRVTSREQLMLMFRRR